MASELGQRLDAAEGELKALRLAGVDLNAGCAGVSAFAWAV